MNNNFNPLDDFAFSGDSFNLPQEPNGEENPVAPAGYTVPERFNRREASLNTEQPLTADPFGFPEYTAAPSPTASRQFGTVSNQQVHTSALYGQGTKNSAQMPYYAASPAYMGDQNTPTYYAPQPVVAEQPENTPEVVDEPEDFFVPPMPKGYESTTLRDRYRPRNFRPLKFPVKAAIFAGVVAVLFTLLSFSIYNIIIGSRVNTVKSDHVSTVRLSQSSKDWIEREVNIEEVDGSSFSQPDTIFGKQKNVDLLLVIGSDNPNGEGYPCTTNAMMLVALDHKKDCVKMVYLSTDLYVRIPGYYSNTLSEAFYYDTANGFDDLPATMECIVQNFGVTPDGFIVVDYLAFETIIERLGGVTLTLTDEEAEYMSSHHIFGIFKRFSSGGSYSMSSSETLNYIRIKEVGDGYLDRLERHRLVFEYLLASAGELSQLELAGIAYDLLPMCSTDLSRAEARKIIKNCSNILDYDFYWMQAPVRGSWRYGIAQTGNGSKKVIVTSYKFTASAIQDFIYADDMQYTEFNTVTGVVLPEVAPEPVSDAPVEE